MEEDRLEDESDREDGDADEMCDGDDGDDGVGCLVNGANQTRIMSCSALSSPPPPPRHYTNISGEMIMITS